MTASELTLVPGSGGDWTIYQGEDWVGTIFSRPDGTQKLSASLDMELSDADKKALLAMVEKREAVVPFADRTLTDEQYKRLKAALMEVGWDEMKYSNIDSGWMKWLGYTIIRDTGIIVLGVKYREGLVCLWQVDHQEDKVSQIELERDDLNKLVTLTLNRLEVV
jgi:hypothetical protein